MASSKAKVPPRFHSLRVLLLMRDGAFARDTLACLEGLGLQRCTHASTLAAVTSVLRAGDTDVIVAGIHADFSDGLMLPSLLRELNQDGRLACVPQILWMGEAEQAGGLAGAAVAGAEAPAGARQGWCQKLSGVSLNALTSHARLARAAGVRVEIVHDALAGGLRQLLEALPESVAMPTRPRGAAAAAMPDEEDVIAALTSGEGLRVVFQPQYDLVTRRMVGAEALIRWRHRRLGDVPPSVLIPLVNRLGLDLLLFSYIEKCAIETLLALDQAGVDIPLAVNASANTLCAPGLAERLAGKMQRAGLPPRRLKLELTEDMVATDELTLSASIAALRAKGFQVSLDDFGAGSATLALLSQMPFDEMKIDGALVRAVAQAPASREIITGIVALARLFDLRLVTEGIEDAATIALLSQLGCRIGQGYALAYPMEGAEFLRQAGQPTAA
ncbi:Bacteriophytochrome cph2 [Achromobacter xylosoxidans]|nr:Bacteriophytochrome cph2 [Achromobacter xylosoxidans]